jgi:phosphoglucosamine mutase
VSQICKLFTPLPQVMKNVRYRSGRPLELPQVKKIITDMERKLGNAGRLVVRPSGTEPLIRVMAEGDDEGLVAQVVDDIVQALEQVAA